MAPQHFLTGSCALSQAYPITASQLLPFPHRAQAKILRHVENHMFFFGVQQEEAWFYHSNKKGPIA